MLKIPFLRNILLIAILFALLSPLYDLFFIIPSYQSLLVQETERDSVRFVRFLVISNLLDHFPLDRKSIPAKLIEDVFQLREEGTLVKLRIFSPSGEIVFSTDKAEIGTINKNKYFSESVAKGKYYSKLVPKKSVTAEGILSDRALVETYIPIFKNHDFHGAMEVYSDISLGQRNLITLSHRSFTILIVASLGLLMMTLLLLFRASASISARDQAKAALLRANEELENRVGQRTAELSSANQMLAAEISERKKAQLDQKKALIATLEARDRINSIISSVADALLVTDHKDCILLINPAAEELFNVRAEAVVGRRLPDVIGYTELLLEVSKARTLLRSHEAIEFDFSMANTGTLKVFQGRASRLRETDVNGRGLILLIHDVTRERQIERMKSEFVSMAAHELQTPLTMILGYSELLLDVTKNFDPLQTKDFLQIINEKSIELSGLIDDILDLSRIEDGRGLELKLSKENVGILCRKLVAEYEENNPLHTFNLKFPEDPLLVEVDRSRLIQVIENLLGNAIKYSPQGGLIKVVLGQKENFMHLDIIDQGIGMTEEEQVHAFERFYRADSSNTAVRGTGLGLSISRFVIEAHGGTIEIFSSKGQGTRLAVRLPMHQ